MTRLEKKIYQNNEVFVLNLKARQGRTNETIAKNERGFKFLEVMDRFSPAYTCDKQSLTIQIDLCFKSVLFWKVSK